MIKNIIYLTGSPATGKTTLGKLLSTKFKEVLYLNYGEELGCFLQKKNVVLKNHEELREKSSQIVKPEHIEEFDSIIIKRINDEKNFSTIILDSHAVTKEQYGYRIIPFKYNKLGSIGFSKIFVLYAQDDIIKNRISNNSQGRRLVNNFETLMHRELQSDLAIIYGTLLGIPIFFFDSSLEENELLIQVKSTLDI